MIKKTLLLFGFLLLYKETSSRQLKQFIPSNWISTCTEKCPETPLDLCDFYFQGYRNTIPYFNMDNNSTTDFQISPQIFDKYINRTVDTYNSTRPACLLNKKNQYKFTNLYYPMSINHIGKVFINMTDYDSKCDNFCGKCLLLYIVKTRPHWKDGNYTLLLSGDGNIIFPEERRCVVFKTENCY